MRILITFETNVSRVSQHKHRISISAPDFFTDFLRGTLARRSHGIHNPKVIYLVSSITQKRNSVNPHIKFPPGFQGGLEAKEDRAQTISTTPIFRAKIKMWSILKNQLLSTQELCLHFFLPFDVEIQIHHLQ